MDITFEVSGGFASIPALSKPVTIRTAELPEPLAEAIARTVDDARFFELPSSIDTTARGAADYFTYLITVRDGGRTHTVRLTDPVEDPSLKRLVSQLRDLARSSGP